MTKQEKRYLGAAMIAVSGINFVSGVSAAVDVTGTGKVVLEFIREVAETGFDLLRMGVAVAIVFTAGKMLCEYGEDLLELLKALVKIFDLFSPDPAEEWEPDPSEPGKTMPEPKRANLLEDLKKLNKML